MVSTQTTDMQNAVILMQHLSKYDWCKHWFSVYG
jgi:hypothetical protein